MQLRRRKQSNGDFRFFSSAVASTSLSFPWVTGCLLQVEIADIKRVYSLFVDVKRSTQFLMEYQKVRPMGHSYPRVLRVFVTISISNSLILA